jgi:uncharacterized repeat protein (TIGR03843 family)
MSAPSSLESLLANGEISLTGQFVWGSNYTFLARVSGEGGEIAAVYKPARGERPLWDFPPGTLAAREVAAYLASRALGWDLVPPTVLRPDGPAGPGSLQLFVDADPERHYFTFSDEEKQRLRPVVAFDILINNADRKGGHVLLSPGGHIWLIDHGVCFHQDDKLRTVIWDFAGERIPRELLDDIERFRAGLVAGGTARQGLSPYLAPEELRALERRAEALLESREFPLPSEDRRPYPWPLV